MTTWQPQRSADAPGPLTGVRVLDLIDGAGAYGPRLLVGLGAEVIRVEPPAGAEQRRRGPLVRTDTGDDASLYFLHYNAGKQGITLNPSSSGGLQLLRRLLDTVDVAFDNGALTRWGLDPALLAEKTPPLVVVSVTPFGLRSARSDWLGGDLICQAMSGMIGLFGYRDERPARFGPEQAAELGGLAAALGALIALFSLRREGRGDFLEVSLERVAALVTLQMSNASVYRQFGVARRRAPRANGQRGVLYAARDGYLTLGAYRKPAELVAMLAAQSAADDLPDLLESLTDAEFSTSAHVEQVVCRFVAQRTRQEVVELAQAQGLFGLPVNDVADLRADPFLQGRAFFVEVEQPGLPAALIDAGPPIRFAASPYRPGRRPPLLGEHNAEVYGRMGIADAELAALRRAGVV